MPTLPQVKSAELGSLGSIGGRRATSEDFAPNGAQEFGRAMQKTAASYLAFTEEEESRKALVESSQIRAKYASELDQAVLDGRDLDELKQKMNDDLAKVGENFQTKKGADSLSVYTANTELMYDQQANHIKVQRATSEAVLGAHKLLNSTAAIMQSNPLYLAEATRLADAFGDTLAGVPTPKRAEIVDGLKKEMNMTAALSSARSNPEGTKKLLEGGAWDLTPQQREHATKEAEHYGNVQRAADERERARVQHERLDTANLARDGYTQRILKGDHGKALYNDIVNDAAFAHYPQYREHLAIFMREDANRLAGQEKKSDQIVRRDLWLDIHAADTDPRKIFTGDKVYAAVAAGKLNTTDANGLLLDVANMRDEDNNTVGQKIGLHSGIVQHAISADMRFTAQPDLVASAQMDYNARVKEKVKEYRTAGKSINDLFSPSSKDWVGDPKFVQQSLTNAVQRRRDSIQADMPRVNTQAEYDALPPNTPYIDSEGKQATKSGKAGSATKPAVTAPAYEGFVKSVPRSSSVQIDAPPKSRAAKLQGQTYPSREAAVGALKSLYDSE